MRDMAWEADLNFTCLRVSGEKERLLGMPDGSLIGKSLLTGMHSEDAAMLAERLHKLQPGHSLARCTLRYVCPEGGRITEMRVTALPDQLGKTAGFAGTERCLGSFLLHNDGTEPFNVPFARAPVAVCMVNRTGTLLAVNEKFANLCAKTVADLEGTNAFSIGLPSLRTAMHVFEDNDQGNSAPEQEIVLYGRDYIVTAFGLTDACGVVQTACVFHRDISLRKSLERKFEAANRLLEEMSLKDYLTGVFNRRQFDVVLEREMARQARANSEMCMAMVDVDVFKLYNDAYGHLAGDECLASVAGAMGRALHRPGDQLFRYGGEEFAIIMPDTVRESGAQVAEHVRNAVWDLNIPHKSSAYERVTISIGVASVGPACARFSKAAREEVIRVADRALYRAKNSGRNAVVSGRCRMEGEE